MAKTKKTIRGKVCAKKKATTHTDAIAKAMSKEIKYHEHVDTYLKMFNPKLVDLPTDELLVLPENTEINGPLQFDELHQRMVKSIRALGQGKPVIVFEDIGHPWIIDGGRITYAAKEAGYTHVTCIVLDVDRERALEIMYLLNSGERKFNYAMRAKRLELIQDHAKRFIKENGIGDSDGSTMETREYIATLLHLSPSYVSDFQAVCAHPDKDTLIEQMDNKLTKLSLKKAAAIARNKTAKVPDLKKTIEKGKVQEFACANCPNRNKFKQAVDNYGDIAGEVAAKVVEESEAGHD